jgi:hypothetical protein
VARYNQGYQEGSFDSQEGRLITRDDSGRQTDIRIYIMNSLYLLETYFRLPNKNYPLDLIEFQDSAQMMRLPYFQAIHKALETRRRAVLSADGNCHSDAYINQALSAISYDIAGCGYDVIQVIGDMVTTKFGPRTTYLRMIISTLQVMRGGVRSGRGRSEIPARYEPIPLASIAENVSRGLDTLSCDAAMNCLAYLGV